MAEDQYATSNILDISKMKVPDLKRELKARGLNTSGNKIDLVQRLSLAIESGKKDSSQGSMDSVEDDLIDEDEVLNDDDIDEEEVATMSISNIDELEINKTFEASKTIKRKSFDDVIEPTKEEKTTKKIILNRNLSTENQPQYDNNETNNSTNGLSDIDTQQKNIVKISEVTAKERLEMRAKKFGAPLSDEAKKAARTARFGQSIIAGDKSKITFENNSSSMDVLKKRAERFGTISTQLVQIQSKEQLEKRKERFGNNTNANGTTLSNDEKKAKRLERFKNAAK